MKTKAKETAKIRFDCIDWIRGCAAFLVLLQHTCEYMYPTFKRWTADFLSIGMSGVVAFFLVSGYVIAHTANNKSISVFIVHRIFRIFPLYWVMLTLGLCSSVFWNDIPTFKVILANNVLIQDYIGLPSYVGGSWTLPLELTFYILFILWRKTNFFMYTWSVPIFSLSVLVLLINVSFLKGRYLPLGRPLLVLTAFQASLWYYKYYKNVQIVHLSIVGIGIIFYIFVIKNAFFSSTCLLLSWIFGYLLFFIFKNIKPARHLQWLMAWMGRLSYSVYLTQGLVLLWIDHLKIHPLVYIITIPTTYALAILLHLFIERPGIEIGKLACNSDLFKRIFIKTSWSKLKG